MDRGVNLVEVFQLGLDAFIIFYSAFGVVIGVVGALTLVNIFRSDLARKQLIKELNQKQKFQQSQTETAEEKAIRHNIEAKHRERVQINREKNLRLIQAEHSEQKLDVKALLDHVLNTQEVRTGSAQQLSWSIGYIYCLFYF